MPGAAVLSHDADAQRLPIILRSATLCKESHQLQGIGDRILRGSRFFCQTLDQPSHVGGECWWRIEPFSFALEIQISLDPLPKIVASVYQLQHEWFGLPWRERRRYWSHFLPLLHG